VLVDLSRLLWRTLARRRPTGIDRVCLVYLARYGLLPETRGIFHWQRLRWVLPRWLTRPIVRFLLWANGMSAAVNLGSMPRVSRAPSGLPQASLFVGHTGLQWNGFARWARRLGSPSQHDAPALVFIHDLIPITHPQYCRAGQQAVHVRRMRQALQAAHGVVVNSQDTAAELVAFAAREHLRMPPVCVAPLAPALTKRSLSLEVHAASSGMAEQSPLSGQYFVVLGTIEARKNHALLLRVWSRWLAEFEAMGPSHAATASGNVATLPTLVVIGQAGWEAEDLLATLRNPPRGLPVVWIPGADDATAAYYLQHATALLMPSFAEGYGLPLAEALAMGVPAVASDLPALREVGEGAVCFLSPDDDSGWVESVKALAADPAAARRELQSAGWQVPTWEQHFTCVEEFLQQQWQPAKRLIVVGFRLWRQVRFLPLLQGLAPGAMKTADGRTEQRAAIHYVRNVKAAAQLQPGPGDTLLCWNLPPWHLEMEALAERTGAASLRMEDGFLRSVGLGSNFVRPLSVVFDTRGLYFDPSRPSDIEHILVTAEFSAEELAEAKTLREFIVEQGLTKYNTDPWPIAGRPNPEWVSQACSKRVLLVPGQVEDDASVRLGGGAVQSTAQLLAAVRATAPKAFIVYRPHPDVMAGNRKGIKYCPSGADVVDVKTPLLQLIGLADEVHTLTSLSGFDALLRGKHVVTYGSPFYAGWGLTEDIGLTTATKARRGRPRALDELVACVMSRYPHYFGPDESTGISGAWLTAKWLNCLRDKK
jgi:glycosyltransferase involved in cell wall biosynthesis